MKRSLTVVALTIVGGSMAFGNNKAESNQVLIASVVEKLGQQAINAFPDPSPILGLLETSRDFLTLSAGGQEMWNQSISSLATNSMDRASRLVLLHSFLYLPPKEYMNCLERVLDLVETGRIQRDEFLYIFLIPPRDESRWFLSYNADKPRMGKYLDRVKMVMKNDSEVLRIVALIAEGKARARDERLRNERGGSSKQAVPRLPDD